MPTFAELGSIVFADSNGVNWFPNMPDMLSASFWSSSPYVDYYDASNVHQAYFYWYLRHAAIGYDRDAFRSVRLVR